MDRKKPNRTEQDQVKAEEDQIGTNQTKLDRMDRVRQKNPVWTNRTK